MLQTTLKPMLIKIVSRKYNMKKIYGKLRISLSFIYIFIYVLVYKFVSYSLFINDCRYNFANCSTFFINVKPKAQSNLELFKFILTALFAYFL